MARPLPYPPHTHATPTWGVFGYDWLGSRGNEDVLGRELSVPHSDILGAREVGVAWDVLHVVLLQVVVVDVIETLDVGISLLLHNTWEGRRRERESH